MKIIIAIILYSLCLNSAYSGMKKNNSCIEKTMIEEYSYDDLQKVVFIKFKTELTDVKLIGLEGLEGLNIDSFSIQKFEKNLNGQVALKIRLIFNPPDGQSRINIMLSESIYFNGRLFEEKEVLSFPIGELSEAQITERSKNVKYVPSLIEDNNGLKLGGRIVHELPLESN